MGNLSMCILDIVVPVKVGTGAAKNSSAQWFRLASLARIFINLSWYDSTYTGDETFDKQVTLPQRDQSSTS